MKTHNVGVSFIFLDMKTEEQFDEISPSSPKHQQELSNIIQLTTPKRSTTGSQHSRPSNHLPTPLLLLLTYCRTSHGGPQMQRRRLLDVGAAR